MKTRPRVAIVSIGIGRFQRGFERFFTDLAGVMDGVVDLTLYGGVPGPGRRVPPALGVLTRLSRLIPVGRVETEYREYKHDCLAYGVGLAVDLARERYDVVHVIDPPLSKAIERLLPAVSPRTRLLYTNGTAWPVHLCPRRARIHHVQQGSYQAALASGDSPERNVLVPCGIHPEAFVAPDEREALRARHGIKPGQFVILVVAAVKRVHKRVDHIIEEVAGLEGDLLLWIDGRPEDREVLALARDRLGPRCRISYVPSHQVGELYKAADVMAHAALDESFGLTVVEAMSTGLPVLAHDSPHFEWLAGSREPLVDMGRPGALRERLAAMMAARAAPSPNGTAAVLARERFDWRLLREEYKALYESTAMDAEAK
jgi:glycosyltransferase involved in cell wall biosynthesis